MVAFGTIQTVKADHHLFLAGAIDAWLQSEHGYTVLDTERKEAVVIAKQTINA